ncbi:ribonuclease P protein component [Phaeovulum vinaykumarii]|uniref:Ribonuclease P protein component n=1 Tax=Phaeovulum vinaykumarii TaxID=407234 RepID=A0A1N7LAC6_9RHOB|nr:ribonuclease P protein component [Phaeovulum vinaykumarii]SIS70788.1 ribonuclease P protein component [Phaeovulum vinaykumarii]SOB98718.1 ribonuclease P protein component [Phaeovulum vinaykumarii]
MPSPETAAEGRTPPQAGPGDDGGACRARPVPTPRVETLRQRADFLRAARALKQGADSFLLQARRRAPGEISDTADSAPALIRVGFTCSKKVGNAVARNRAKRRLRAAVREVLPGLGKPGWDYVLVGRPEATIARDFAELKADLARALGRIHSARPQAARSQGPRRPKGPKP